jgi:pseudouridylate synthase I
MKLLLELSFIGTNYCGFQVQQNGVSIQKTVQNAAEKVFGPVKLTGCSRTDSGVHARVFYCTAEGEGCSRIPPENVPMAFNSLLPDDIAVKSARIVDDLFHPRYSAKGKEYRYIILNSRIRDPFLEGRVYRFPSELNTAKMDYFAKQFIGLHDFAAFMAAGSKVADTKRTVSMCRVTREDETVTLAIAADGFLYNMVRIIAGTLIDCSRGKINEPVDAIIASHDRCRAGFTAPPEGLYLWDVFY